MGLMDDLQKEADDIKSNNTSRVGGTPMFTENDVLKTSNMLARMLRVIFIENNVTTQSFTEMHREYALTKLNMMPSNVSTSKGNMMALIASGNMTWKKFYEIVVNMMGYDLDLAISLKKNNVDVKTYNYVEEMTRIADKTKNVKT